MNNILYYYYSFIAIVLLIDGVAIFYYGFNLIETAFHSIALVLLTCSLLLRRRIATKTLIIIFIIVIGNTIAMIITVMSTWSMLDVAILFQDTVKYLLLPLLLYDYLKNTSINRIVKIVEKVFYIITFLIILHYLTKVGGTLNAKGELRPIYGSFYNEINAIAILYFISYLVLFANSDVRNYRIMITLLTVIASILLSTKLNFLAITVFLYLVISSKIYVKNRILGLICIMPFLLFIIWFIIDANAVYQILVIILGYALPDGANLLHRLQFEDVFTILMSFRNIEIATNLSQLDGVRYFIGFGPMLFENLGLKTESDLFDIYFKSGILFLFTTSVFLLYLFFEKNGNNYIYHKLFLLFYVIGASSLTGHVLTSMVGVTAVALGAAYFTKMGLRV